MKIWNSRKGFTLIEVVIALAVLSFGILSMILMQLSGIKGNSTANTITTESNWASDRIEQLLRVDFDDLVDLDKNGDADGTAQDPDGNGIDEITANGDNFGLDDVGVSIAGGCTAAPADDCFHNDLYDIFWNVAVDHPVPDAIKIKIIVVQNRGKSNRVEFEYMKTKIN